MSDEMHDKHMAVLGRLERALPDIGVNGWFDGVAAVKYAIAALSAQPAAGGDAVAWAVLERQDGPPVKLCYDREDASDWCVSASSDYRNQQMPGPSYNVRPLVYGDATHPQAAPPKGEVWAEVIAARDNYNAAYAAWAAEDSSPVPRHVADNFGAARNRLDAALAAISTRDHTP